jgi:N-acetylglutamate synthase-like GNAT family acetyltransferase
MDDWPLELASRSVHGLVVIAPEHRGHCAGAWLTQCILEHPELQGFRRVARLTRDAERFYARAGFITGPGVLVYMERRPAATFETQGRVS